jgi:hypothetical protein
MAQLQLFKSINIRKLDSILTQYHHNIYAYKTLAYHIDISIGKNRPFNMALECSWLASEVCEELEGVSLKYQESPINWKSILPYNPYYAAVEPRTHTSLYESTIDYKNRSKALLLLLEGCLKGSGIVVPKQAYKLTDKLNNLALTIKHEGNKL